MKVKNFYNILIIIIAFNASAQEKIIQRGMTVYYSSNDDKDSALEYQYSFLCNSYINKYYSNMKLPLIYLIIGNTNDSLKYQLSYDDLMGYSWSAPDKKGGKYLSPGIRITISASQNTSEGMLKLLDFGINHLKELEKTRKEVLKRDNDPHTADFSVNQKEISLIINEPLTDQMKTILSQKQN